MGRDRGAVSFLSGGSVTARPKIPRGYGYGGSVIHNLTLKTHSPNNNALSSPSVISSDSLLVLRTVMAATIIVKL